MVLSIGTKYFLQAFALTLLMLISSAGVSGQEETPIHLDWHPNGEIIAVGHNNEVKIIDVISDTIINTIPDADTLFTAPVWNSDGTLLATSDGFSINIWRNAITPNQIELDGMIEPLSRYVDLFDWSPDGTKFALEGSVVEVWSYPEKQLLFTQETHVFGWGQVAWSRDSSSVASAGVRGSILGWDGISGNLLFSLDVMSSYNTQFSERFIAANTIAWTMDSSQLVMGVKDGSLRVWTIPTQVGVSTAITALDENSYKAFDAEIISVDINPTNNLIAISSILGEIRIFDLSTREYTASTYVGAPNTMVAWSPSGEQIAFQNLNGAIETVVIEVDGVDLEALHLFPLCSLNPDTIRVWQVSNPNADPVNFTWEVSGTTQTGSGTVLGGSEENPGVTTFETAAFATSDVVSIAVGGTVQGSAASDSTAVTDTATLISAIANANNSADINTICLADGTYTLTASNVIDYGDNGLPLITSDLTLVGLGDNVVIERGAGAPAFRLLHVKDTGTLTLENLTLSNGNAGITHGGAVYARGALTLRDVTITGNFARRGGGVRMNGAPLTVTGSTFQNNSADREGGAIYVSGINSPVDLSTSQFNANSATNSGGGFYLSGTTTSLVANDVVFTGNQANGGGAIYAVPSTLNITNATFTSNEALVSSGGAIYTSTDSSVAVANSTFTTNEAGSDGGALRAGGNLTLTGSTLTSNVADVGAAVFSQNAATITGNRIELNAASELGGGLYVSHNGNTHSITGNCISGNTAPQFSGLLGVTANTNATDNWWGATDGPVSGNTVSANVIFTPFLSACPLD